MVAHRKLANLLFFSLVLTLSSTIFAAPPEKVDVLIGFRQPPGPQDLATVARQGGRITHTYRLVPAIAATVPQNALAGLMAAPNVVVVEPDGKVQAIEYDAVWGVTRIGSEIAHNNLLVSGVGVNVAVIDSGIDIDHPDLAANYKGGIDFVNDDDDPDDDNGHGTHCAGTIGAVADGIGVVGVAPNVNLYAVKVLDEGGSGSFSDIIAALEWCVLHNIHLTNNSYGSSQDPGTIVAAAFNNAEAAGILNIAAAGNSGRFNGKGNTVGYPARYESVVAVAATDQSDERAYFSSTGPDVELAAPGYLIYSTFPGGYGTASGTSMACPHAVGTAALLIQAGLEADQEVSPAIIRQALAESAEDLGDARRDPHFGFGLVDTVIGIGLIQTGIVPPDGGGDPPAEAGTMTVSTIDYQTSGGKNQDKDLNIIVRVSDSDTLPPVGVPNANVAVTAYLNGEVYGTASGTTDSSGDVSFKARNAESGEWTIIVDSVTADGYSWDGGYPITSFTK